MVNISEYNDYKDRYTVSRDAELLGRIAVETVIGRMNRKEITEFSPLVIIIDDYDDLFEDNVFSVIQRSRLPEIAKYSPGVNVHLIISTQLRSLSFAKRMYPTELTDNIKTRIAFRVISRQDSEQILGTEGAHSLCGHGDGLYAHSDQIVRFQGSCSCLLD